MRFKFIMLSVMLSSLLFLPFNSKNVFSSGGGGSEESHGEAHSEGLPGDVPFDRPLTEVKKELAPMNQRHEDVEVCSDCHDEEWETNHERRELDEPHDVVPGKFVNHDSDNRWCLDCHSAKNRDMLRLLNGKLIKYDEYYRVCEQCHRKVYRKWKMGVHGKRTGYWNGTKEHMHCAQCHNPHDPPFKPLKPMPAPRTPLKARIMKSKGK
jgi:hypothetical protein